MPPFVLTPLRMISYLDRLLMTLDVILNSFLTGFLEFSFCVFRIIYVLNIFHVLPTILCHYKAQCRRPIFSNRRDFLRPMKIDRLGVGPKVGLVCMHQLLY